MFFKQIEEIGPREALINWTHIPGAYVRLILRITKSRNLYIRLRFRPFPVKLFVLLQNT